MADVSSCVLSIAGFDPSGGAGILADIKTFEANQVSGMGALSALTFQNDILFEGLKWIEADEILQQISVLQKRFKFSVIKIGLIRDLEVLKVVVKALKQAQPGCQIIWDPIVKASAGFQFHSQFEREQLFSALENCFLITPNTDEVQFLTGIDNPKDAAQLLAKYVPVLLKGGHSKEEPGVDYLFMQNKIEKIFPTGKEVFAKHGSGCVLSAAIASNLAKGKDLVTACLNAKTYVEQFLSSNETLLGTHDVHPASIHIAR
ncbi:MAG: hydroxymethylpyrimidine/phosphomethylpyrimidine kinase [Bacteroidota bacterium]|nr:hydroxymethylpyrimidine/phosphomethylpyrimidine kinase [Bacteroidota bacterium]